jgi:hypothetical protein
MKISPWTAIKIGLHIATAIIDALKDKDTPGHITEAELRQIIADALEYALAQLAP